MQSAARINYVEALEACGVQAVVSADVHNPDGCDVLPLPGGVDIDPGFYGADNLGRKDINRELDLTELDPARKFFQP